MGKGEGFYTIGYLLDHEHAGYRECEKNYLKKNRIAVPLAIHFQPFDGNSDLDRSIGPLNEVKSIDGIIDTEFVERPAGFCIMPCKPRSIWGLAAYLEASSGTKTTATPWIGPDLYSHTKRLLAVMPQLLKAKGEMKQTKYMKQAVNRLGLKMDDAFQEGNFKKLDEHLKTLKLLLPTESEAYSFLRFAADFHQYEEFKKYWNQFSASIRPRD